MIWHAPTSILRPSTTVPCRRSRARSASLLLANVTKPNPCHSQSNMQLKKHIEYIDYDFQKTKKIKRFGTTKSALFFGFCWSRSIFKCIYIYIYYVYYKYIKLKLQIHQQGGQGHAFRTGAIGTSLYSGGVWSGSVVGLGFLGLGVFFLYFWIGDCDMHVPCFCNLLLIPPLPSPACHALHSFFRQKLLEHLKVLGASFLNYAQFLVLWQLCNYFHLAPAADRA